MTRLFLHTVWRHRQKSYRIQSVSNEKDRLGRLPSCHAVKLPLSDTVGEFDPLEQLRVIVGFTSSLAG